MGPVIAARRRSRVAGLALVLVAWAVVAGAQPALAADPVTFGEPSATSSFGKKIEFKQPVTLDAKPQLVEILLTTPGAIGPSVLPLPTDTASGTSTLTYQVDLANGGHVVPNTTFTAQWRVTDANGRIWLSPKVRRTYADDRFDWKTVDGDVVRVHWTEGNQDFGKRALRIGEDAVSKAASLLGVTETEPIDVFVYADQQAFYDALGPSTRENVGGQAHPDIRTLFALITPADIDASWVESVVPHELTHLVFQTAVDNPYHDPPHWLNEGLAVYLSDGYADFDRSQVEEAARNGSIMPLDGLAGAFPTTRDRFFLAYAESVSAVDRIVRVDGRDALVKLIRSYADGVSDDDAFQAALGTDVAGFEQDWLAELGASPPNRVGPRPAPAGPLPEGWSGPVPNPSFEIVGSLPPVQPNTPGPAPSRPGQDPLAFLVAPLATIGLALVLVLGIVAYRRIARRPAMSSGAPDDGGNRLFGRGPISDEPPPAAIDPAVDPTPEVAVAPPDPAEALLEPPSAWARPATPEPPPPDAESDERP